jgi:hypothetical protein
MTSSAPGPGANRPLATASSTITVAPASTRWTPAGPRTSSSWVEVLTAFVRLGPLSPLASSTGEPTHHHWIDSVTRLILE